MSKKSSWVTSFLFLLILLELLGGFQFAHSSTNGDESSNSAKALDAIWIATSFFQKPEDWYFDLQRNGDLLVKKDGQETAEVRVGQIPLDITNQAFQIVNSRAVLNARDSGPGEPLFSQSEWARVSVMLDKRIGSSESAPLENFPVTFQKLLIEFKSRANGFPLASDIKAFLVAEQVDSQRAESIKHDPRKFFEFITLKKSDLDLVPAMKQAIEMIGRQIPVRSDAELQTIEAYIKQSNLKSMGHDFFITVSGRSYQLHLLINT